MAVVTAAIPQAKKDLEPNCLFYAFQPSKPDPAVAKIIQANDPGNYIPQMFFVTPEGDCLKALMGYRSPKQLAADLQECLQSPLLKAKPEVEAKLKVIGERADKAVAKEDWAGVLKAAGDAAALKGRSDTRTAIETTAKKAETSALAAYDSLVSLTRDKKWDEANPLATDLAAKYRDTSLQDRFRDAKDAVSTLQAADKAASKSLARSKLAQAEKKFADTPFAAIAADWAKALGS